MAGVGKDFKIYATKNGLVKPTPIHKITKGWWVRVALPEGKITYVRVKGRSISTEPVYKHRLKIFSYAVPVEIAGSRQLPFYKRDLVKVTDSGTRQFTGKAFFTNDACPVEVIGRPKETDAAQEHVYNLILEKLPKEALGIVGEHGLYLKPESS